MLLVTGIPAFAGAVSGLPSVGGIPAVADIRIVDGIPAVAGVAINAAISTLYFLLLASLQLLVSLLLIGLQHTT
jgi:hypothetical protein